MVGELQQPMLGGSLRADQIGVFRRLRWWMFCNSTHLMVQQGLLRLVTIIIGSTLIWGFVFAAAIVGFHFLGQRYPLTGDFVRLFLDPLFLSLSGLLVFSTGLILYSSLFAKAESAFLLCTPAGADQVFAYKYQDALTFSSWGFFLLGSPVMIAYGMVAHVPWYFFAFLPFFFLGFVLLPGCLGATVCLLVVNYLPRQRKWLLVAVVALILGVVGLWGYRVAQVARPEAWNRDMAYNLEDRLSLAQYPLLPSTWLTRGLRAVARQNLTDAGYYLTLLWSNGLFAYVVTAWLARHLYRRGFNRMVAGDLVMRRYGGHWLDRILAGMVGFLHPQTRLLVVKDFRTFRRDPVQWAQIVIFLGLMILYFANIPRMFGEQIEWSYQNSISLMNLTSTALLLCAYTGRFIFPLLSLEGQKFWILGLLPLRRERLLWGKFAFAACGGLLIAEFLVVLSDVMLHMTWLGMVVHILTTAVLAVGLSALSVGLGACLPNFRESDPSRIAVGFGGTMNLVAGLLFLLIIVGLMAGPWHVLGSLAEQGEVNTPLADWVVAIGLFMGLVAGIGTTVLALRSGVRALARMEF